LESSSAISVLGTSEVASAATAEEEEAVEAAALRCS
jgi:hypothetical protein